jgi:thioredoxin-like negative regulator of GroEL
VPKTALIYQGRPVAQFEGIADEHLIRKNGQWYLVME